MATWVGTNSFEDNRFKTISDFKHFLHSRYSAQNGDLSGWLCGS